MNFLDQTPQVATEKHLALRWSGGKPGERFRCYLCGHKFQVGDVWRFVLSTVWINFLVCEKCDGEDVVDRWAQKIAELREKAWWLWESAYKE